MAEGGEMANLGSRNSGCGNGVLRCQNSGSVTPAARLTRERIERERIRRSMKTAPAASTLLAGAEGQETVSGSSQRSYGRQSNVRRINEQQMRVERGRRLRIVILDLTGADVP
jgi:hypothetical protein